MEIEKPKVLIEFLLIFMQSGDVFFFLYARSLRGYTATVAVFRQSLNVLTFYWSLLHLIRPLQIINTTVAQNRRHKCRKRIALCKVEKQHQKQSP